MKQKQTGADEFDTQSLLRETVEKLRDLLRSVELHGDGEHASTIQDTARISVAITSACAELRQHSKAAKRALASYSVEAIMAYLLTMPLAERRELAAELTGARDNEGLL